MSRTTIEVPLKTNNIDEVINIIKEKLESAKFQQKIVDGETVWSKGDGVMIKMSCFAATFTGKSVLLQGWMKDAITGESNLDGFAAIVLKKKLKSIISEISTAITSRNL